MATNIVNLGPAESGVVVGCLKSFVGLGAGSSTQFFRAYFASKPINFLLFLAGAPSVVGVVSAVFTNVVTGLDGGAADGIAARRESAMMRRACIVSALTALAVSSVVLLSALAGFMATPRARAVAAWVIMAALTPLLASPSYTGGWICAKTGDGGLGDVGDAEDGLFAPLLDESLPLRSVAAGEKAEEAPALGVSPSPSNDPDDIEGLTFGETIQTVDFWLIFGFCGVVVGGGLTLLHNLGQLVPAISGGRTGDVTLLVQLFSLANCLGRVGTGWLSQYCVNRRWAPRTLFTLLVNLVMTLNAVWLTRVTTETLYACVLIGGVAFGSNWSLVPSILSDVFGPKAWASTYNFIGLSSTIGDMALSTALAGHLYDLELKRKGIPPGGVCVGKDCFEETFTVVGLVSTFGW